MKKKREADRKKARLATLKEIKKRTLERNCCACLKADLPIKYCGKGENNVASLAYWYKKEYNEKIPCCKCLKKNKNKTACDTLKKKL
jgi:hypothetical protein